MRPTPRMLRPPYGEPPALRFPEAPRIGRAIDPEDLLAERRERLKQILAESRSERREGGIRKAIDEALEQLTEAPLEAPEIGVEGAVVVRVIGRTRGRDAARFPLSGVVTTLVVRERGEEETAAEAVTDRLGLAVLEVPEGSAGRYEVQALAPDGTVVARRPGGRGEPRHDLAAPTFLLEVGPSEALAPAFARGETWAEAAVKARERAAALAKAVEKALDAQERALAETIERMAASPDADPTTKPYERPRRS